MKICKTCGLSKTESEFYANKLMRDGLESECKDCARLYQSRYSRTDAGRATDRKRNSNPSRKRKNQIASKTWAKNNHEKRLAHSRLWHAILSGEIVRKTVCDECGSAGRIEAHHDDYSKPLDVKWLCSRCHGKRNPAFKYIDEQP